MTTFTNSDTGERMFYWALTYQPSALHTGIREQRILHTDRPMTSRQAQYWGEEKLGEEWFLVNMSGHNYQREPQ